jgi:hypothetical protein
MAFFRIAIGASALLAALATTVAGVLAHDETKYPDWSCVTSNAGPNGVAQLYQR